jgi:3D (Asp-Asp-Asp) domain-containing protein
MRRLILAILIPLIIVAVAIATVRYSRYLSTRVAPVRYPVGTVIRNVSTSGYATSPRQTDATPCVGAAGTIVGPGTVAANFIIPLGTIVKIEHPALNDLMPNQKIFITEDRMNRRYYRAIDILFPSTSTALVWGRRPVTVTILGYGKPGEPLPSNLLADSEPSPTSPVVEAGSPTFLDNTRYALQALPRYLRAAVNPGVVNRYDVNCGPRRPA